MQKEMQNRELSWLKFNERVLQEANRAETPLLERLKFISIFTSNLDEFFMVRVGSLTDYALLKEPHIDNKTGLTAQQQLDEIFRAVAPLYELRDCAFTAVMNGLKGRGLQMVKLKEADAEEERQLKKYFIQEIMPLLSPQIIDSRHPFPHLANKQLQIVVILTKKKRHLFGLIPMPDKLERLIFLENTNRFVLLEDLIEHFADMVFDIYEVLEKNIITVTRNADINTEEDFIDEDIDYRQHMKNLLKKRRRLAPVRLEMVQRGSSELLEFFLEKLRLKAEQVFYSSAPLQLSFAFSIEKMISPQKAKGLVWPPHQPADTLSIDKKTNMLRLAAGRDMLFSYPFETMAPFLELIRQAAEDSSVLSIKITLYRIDDQSKLAESLIRAAENGKEITVLMELRARFDENNNIKWAQRLEEAGCRVIYGLFEYKVHSKICLITRKELGRVHYITQIGTGNYNEKTAKQYTDLSLITGNQDIGRDAGKFFANLLLGNLEGKYDSLWVAPNSLKSNLLKSIEEEREKARSGEEASIIIKCNSLTDKEIIEELVAASVEGVKIFMIVRGICCVRPQLAGRTENIRVISIVGRFLEHSRIFCFGTGEERKIYISSADLMTRNTQRRVEVACPILDTALKDRIYAMLETMMMDNTHGWEQYSDGRYILRNAPDQSLAINSQEMFAEEAHLSAVHGENVKTTGKHNADRITLRERFRQLFKFGAV